MTTPAVLIIPLIRYWGNRAQHPRVKMVLRAIVLSSAGLLWSATLPIAREAVQDPVTLIIVIASVGGLLTRKVDSLWVILSAALLQLAAASVHLVGGL
jgi:chromate transporter